MNKSTASKTNFLGRSHEPARANRKDLFRLLACGVFILSGGATAAITPVTVAAAKTHAAYAAGRGESLAGSNTKQAIAYYQVAVLLDKYNQRYSQQLSDAYLKQGMVSKALESLRGTKGNEDQIAQLLLRLDRPDEAVLSLQDKVQRAPSGPAYLLLTRAYLEKQSYQDAKTASDRAKEYAGSREEGIVLGVIASKLRGASDISHTSVASQEAVRMIAAAKTGKAPLAQLLYDMELLRSSQYVLDGISNQSASTYQLQAHIKLAQTPTSHNNLVAASELLRKATAIAPHNIALHRQLIDVYSSLGKSDAAQEEKKLVQLLEKGTP